MRLRLIYAFITRCAISMSEMEGEWNCCNTRDRVFPEGATVHTVALRLEPSSDRAGNLSRFLWIQTTITAY
jgi:hypothetical protein